MPLEPSNTSELPSPIAERIERSRIEEAALLGREIPTTFPSDDVQHMALRLGEFAAKSLRSFLVKSFENLPDCEGWRPRNRPNGGIMSTERRPRDVALIRGREPLSSLSTWLAVNRSRFARGSVNHILIIHDHGCRYPWGDPCTCPSGPEIKVAGENSETN
jgi:hypothetical protein